MCFLNLSRYIWNSFYRLSEDEDEKIIHSNAEWILTRVYSILIIITINSFHRAEHLHRIFFRFLDNLLLLLITCIEGKTFWWFLLLCILGSRFFVGNIRLNLHIKMSARITDYTRWISFGIGNWKYFGLFCLTRRQRSKIDRTMKHDTWNIIIYSPYIIHLSGTIWRFRTISKFIPYELDANVCIWYVTMNDNIDR